MVSKGILLATALLVVAVAFVPAAEAQEQSKVAETRLEIATNPFLSVGNRLARGDDTQGFVNVGFCHKAGGFNPQNAGLEVTLEVTDAPTWLEVQVSSELTQRLQFPFGPTTNQNEVCPPETSLSWDLVAIASDDAPYGETGTVTVAITTSEDGTQHTYQIPAGGPAQLGVQIEDDPGDDVLVELENASSGGGSTAAPSTPTGGGGDSNESPAAPMALLVMGLVGLLAFLRRN